MVHFGVKKRGGCRHYSQISQKKPNLIIELVWVHYRWLEVDKGTQKVDKTKKYRTVLKRGEVLNYIYLFGTHAVNLVVVINNLDKSD